MGRGGRKNREHGIIDFMCATLNGSAQSETPQDGAPDTGSHQTDVVIIGAGPAGLFAVFELGLLGIKAHIIDVLERPGGQCAELYPQKPIYDIPGFPKVTGLELVDRLVKQAAPFDPHYHLGEMASAVEKRADGRWRVRTDRGAVIDAPVIVIAGGGGSFQPKKPRIPDIEAFESASVFYSVRERDQFAGKRLIIAGGGDSALDWTLDLFEIAESVTLVHRRPEFRGAPDSAAKVLDRVKVGDIGFHVAEITELSGSDGRLDTVVLTSAEGELTSLPCDALLAFYGLTMKLGPIAEFGVNLERNRISVSTETFETSEPQIFAIGDMCWYPGKLKLILSGFHEAALMAHGAFHYVFPDKKLKFQHTTSSTGLQEKLEGGVA